MGLEDEVKKDEGNNNEGNKNNNENNGEGSKKREEISEDAWKENEGFWDNLNPEQIAKAYMKTNEESKVFYENYISKQSQERASEIRKYIEKEKMMLD